MRDDKAKRRQHEGFLDGRQEGRELDRLVSVESQREFDLFTGEWAHRIFVKLYVAARTSGLLAAISDRDWKTLCTLATYMDGEGFCYPSQAELAAAMGCSRQMANERVRSLASFRFQNQPVLVIVKGKRGAAGKWSGNGYRVLSLSSLRIYGRHDDPEAAPARTNDSGIDSGMEGGETVSSALDTVRGSEATVSSRTGTVTLDTNKNHSLERDVNTSNFERSHDQVGGTGEGRETTGQPVQSAAIVNGASAAGPARLKDLIAGRRQISGGPRRGRAVGTSEDRERLRVFLEDFAIELGDESPLSSTITRTLTIFTTAGVPPAQWGDYLYQARGLTQEHTAQIRKTASGGDEQIRRKNKMPYFLATLEQLVGLRPDAPSRHPPQAT